MILLSKVFQHIRRDIALVSYDDDTHCYYCCTRYAVDATLSATAAATVLLFLKCLDMVRSSVLYAIRAVYDCCAY